MCSECTLPCTVSVVCNVSTWAFSRVLLFAFPKVPDAMILVFVVFCCLCVIDYWFVCFFMLFVCLFELSGTINVDRCVLVPRCSFSNP